jgi:hypothetical protein
MTERALLHTPALLRCRCGCWLPMGSTASRDARGRHDCVACRPRRVNDLATTEFT